MKATVWRSQKHLLHPVKLGCPETFQVESETEYSLRYGSALWILEEQDVQGSVHCSPESRCTGTRLEQSVTYIWVPVTLLQHRVRDSRCSALETLLPFFIR